MECESGDDLVSTCRNVVVAGVRCVGRGRKTWRECVKETQMSLVCTLNGQCSGICGMWTGPISGKTSNPS